jgi:signal transduction histidine kinase/ActR/RegA family two-component response regulator
LDRAAPGPGWRRALLPVLCFVVLALALMWSQLLTHDRDEELGTEIVLAQSWAPARTGHFDALPPDEAAWQPTALPDNWKQTRPVEPPGGVWYRIAVDTHGMAAPAILIPRLATSGQVLLNGSTLWDSRSREHGVTRSWNAPLLLRLPEGLMRASGNDLLIEVLGQPRYRSGLSTIQLAPYETLLPRYRWRQLWQHDGAMLSCCLTLLAGLMLLLTWLVDRASTMLLYFGLATVVWTARNSNLFLDELPISINAWAAMIQGGHAWFGTLFGLFVLRFTGTRWRRFEWALWGYALVNTGLMLSGQLTQLEVVVRLLALPGAALYVVLVGLLWRKGWRDRSVESALIAATTMTFVMLSLRDALLLDSRLPYEAYYISHYTGALMLVAIVWSLVTQLVTARGVVERLNIGLEQRVAQRTLELAEANAAKTRFIAAASHDLRQPVVTIGLLVGLVREQLPGPPALRGMVERIHAAVVSMEGLLNGLMDLSRLEPGTLKPRLQTVSLAWIFDAISRHEHPAAALKGLSLTFRATPLAVDSDPVLLDQIVRNFVSNAIRYTERGGVLVTARRRRGNKVLLQVWDTGCGIPADAQADVFEEFVQLDNPGRDRSRGQGLGLAIARRSADAMGHALHLRSVPGRGSCFGIELPLAEVPPAPAVVQHAVPDPLRGRRIWLIEDDAEVSAALTLRLGAWGATVETLASATAVRARLTACDAADAPLPDLIVSDQRLPDGSGLACIALVRAHAGREVPSVILTGDTAPADVARLQATGLPLLFKPFRPAELLALLHRAQRDAATASAATS